MAKLNAAGNALSYGTFLGGSIGGDIGYAITVDAKDNIYLTGVSNETCPTVSSQYCFPTTTGAVQQIQGIQKAFVSVFSANGALAYSTLLGDDAETVNSGSVFCTSGGCGATYGTGIALDSTGNFYVTGFTQSANLPTTVGAFQTTALPVSSGTGETRGSRAFAGKLSAVPTSGYPTLDYLTYIGGMTTTSSTYGTAVAVDASGDLVVTTATGQDDLPTTSGAYQTACDTNEPGGGLCNSAYILKLNPAGSSEVWATYLGYTTGSAGDGVAQAGPMALDYAGNVYVALAVASDFPAVDPVTSLNGGNQQGAAVKLSPDGTKLLSSTLLGGGDGNDFEGGIAVDPTGTIYFGGDLSSQDFTASSNAFQKTYGGGGSDGFLAVIQQPLATTVAVTASPATSITVGSSATLKAKVTSTGAAPVGSVTFKVTNPPLVLGSETLSGGSASLTVSTAGQPAGTYPLQAVYSGASSLATSTGSLSVTLTKATPSVALSETGSPATPPAAVTLTAKLAEGNNAGAVTGTVSFYASGQLLGTSNINNGSAVYSASTSGVPAGTYSVTAKYNGNSYYNSVTSSAISATVR